MYTSPGNTCFWINVLVSTWDDPAIVAVHSNSLTDEVLSALQSFTGLTDVILRFNCTRLPDYQTVPAVNIKAGSTLTFEPRPTPLATGKIELHIKGKTVTVHVEPSNTITELKMAIQEKDGIPHHEMRLILSGQAIEQGRLSDYHIQDQTVLHLSLKLRGEMYHCVSAREDFEKFLERSPNPTVVTFFDPTCPEQGFESDLVLNWKKHRSMESIRLHQGLLNEIGTLEDNLEAEAEDEEL